MLKCSDGTPFSGVTVTASKNGTTLANTITGENGNYNLSFNSNDTIFTIIASYPGHIVSSENVSVDSNSHQGTADFQLGMDDVYVSTAGNDKTGDGTQGNPYQTIQKGVNNVNSGGIVHLTNGTYTGSSNVKLTLNKNVNIVGESQGSTVINGENKNWIFFTTYNLMLQNLTVKNGLAEIDVGNIGGQGAAVMSYGNLTVLQCTFDHNVVYGMNELDDPNKITAIGESYGGAICTRGGNVTIINCTFTNNKAALDVSSLGFVRATASGGAVYVMEGTLTVINSTFTMNSVHAGAMGLIYANDRAYGGAIYIEDGSLTLINCQFNKNTADSDEESPTSICESYGGAVYSTGGTVTVSNCYFEGNGATAYLNPSVGSIYGTVGGYGGAICIKDGTLNVTSSNFSKNSVSAASKRSLITDINACGGAIYNMNSNAVLRFNRIVGNTGKWDVAIWCKSSTVDANLNWWGTNGNPSDYVEGNVDITNWLVLTVTNSNDLIPTSGNSTIVADLTHDSNGVYHDPSLGHVPDETQVDFSSTLSSVNPGSALTSNGVATTTFTAGTTPGKAGVQVTVDSATASTPINIGGGSWDVYVSTTGDDTTGDGTESKPYKTIFKAISMVYSGGNIHFLSGTYTGSDYINLVFNKKQKLNLIGEGTVIFDAQNLSRIFTINSGYTVTISNIIFQNGNSTGEGGAILNYGNLTVNNCTFLNNSAQQYGGAISNELNGNLSVINSTFRQNTGNVNGGTIESQGRLLVDNSVFLNNTAKYEGGAVDIGDHGTLTVTNSNFAYNATAHDGGAIYSYADTLTVTNSNFTSNTAGNHGGAIYNYCDGWYGNLTVTNCTFTGNTAVSGYNGGAIYNFKGVLIINNSTFTQNNATYGGAVDENQGILTVTNSKFNQNNGSSSGGAINTSGTATITGSTFTGNVGGYGGAIDTDGTLTIDKCTFAGNNANYGGAIANSVNLTVTNSTIINNTATYDGAAIFNDDNGNVVLHFNRIVGNSPNTSVIYSGLGTVNAQYNWWGSNSNPSGMAGTVDTNSWLVLSINANPTTILNGGNSTITTNLLYDINGRYYDPVLGHVPDDVPVSFTGTLGNLSPTDTALLNSQASSTFIANTGGKATIYATVDDQTVEIQINIGTASTNVTLDNVQDLAGKTVDLTAYVTGYYGNPVNEGSVEFIVNGVNAGFALVHNGVTTLNWTIPSDWTVGNYTVTANYLGTSSYDASTDTGILSVDSLMAYVSTQGNDAWDGQSAVWNGKSGPKATVVSAISILAPNGTIYILSGNYNQYNIIITENMTITGENQVGTIINANGLGTIFNITNGVNFTICNLTLKNGNATYGGAIYSEGNLTVTNCTFNGNNATGGGAIMNLYGNLTVANSTFTGNNATGGGAILNIGDLHVVNCIFKQNSATDSSGGAIMTIDGNSTVANSTFTDNNAVNSSGGAIINLESNLTITNSTFTGNTVTNGSGGALMNLFGDLNVTNSTFSGNNATYGGAIMNWYGDAVLQFNRIVGNTASLGSAIYCDYGTLDATLNWWGSNNSPADKVATGMEGIVNYDPWIVLTTNTSSNKVLNGGSSNITVDLLHDSNGSYHNPSLGHVPDGTSISFAGTLGNLNPVNTVLINGQAASVFTANAAGTAVINAIVDGVTVPVSIASQATTSTTVDNVTIFVGQTVTFTAHVTDYYGNSVNEGSVKFVVNGKDVVTPVKNGIVTLTVPFNWTVGDYIITANYLGTSIYDASTGTGTLKVNYIPTNVSVTSQHNYAGQETTLTATVTDYWGKPVSNGSVNFTVNNVNAGSVNIVNGVATLNWKIPSDWTVGNYTITAYYLGNENYTASSGNNSLTVQKTPTIITVENITGLNSQTVDLKAKLTDSYGHLLTGKTVNFKMNGTNIGTATTGSDGIATLNYKLNGTKNFVITAEFAGNSAYINSTVNGTLTVNPSADLYLMITTSSKNPKVCEQFLLTYKLGNKGPDAAQNVEITFKLPEGLDFVNLNVDTGKCTYNETTRTVTWTLESVPVGDPYLYFTVKATSVGTYKITPSITSTTYNWNSGDNGSITFNVQSNSNNNSSNASSNTVNAASTISMQKTGLPLNYLILAILMVLSGLIIPKNK